MIDQLNLVDLALSHRREDSLTSRIAGTRDPLAREGDRWLVLCALIEAGNDGLTDHELGERIGRTQPSAGKRRLELEREGLVERRGVTRMSPSGSPAQVAFVTPAGRVAWASRKEKAA